MYLYCGRELQSNTYEKPTISISQTCEMLGQWTNQFEHKRFWLQSNKKSKIQSDKQTDNILLLSVHLQIHGMTS